MGFSPLCGGLRHRLGPSVLDNGEGEASVEPVNEVQQELRSPTTGNLVVVLLHPQFSRFTHP